MSDEIRSIRIESNNICYGPEPGAVYDKNESVWEL